MLCRTQFRNLPGGGSESSWGRELGWLSAGDGVLRAWKESSKWNSGGGSLGLGRKNSVQMHKCLTELGVFEEVPSSSVALNQSGERSCTREGLGGL